MALDIGAIETFFDAKFEYDLSVSKIGTIFHFDGFVHWTVYFNPEDDFLFFAADRNPEPQGAFPFVEIGIFCSGVSTVEALGVGPILQLHPKDMECETGISITKIPSGHLPLSATIGKVPTD